MRILVIAPTPFFADRGCHVRILGEAKALRDIGHSIKICTYHLGKDIDGTDTERTINIPWYHKLSAGPSIHKCYIDLLLLWTVLQTCRRFRPHMIHAHLHEGMVIGKFASLLYGIPMVADIQGSLTEELLDHKFIPRWNWLIQCVRGIEKIINKLPNHLIASSTATAKLVEERFGFSHKDVTAIGDGVDLAIFYPRDSDLALKTSLNISQGDKVIVFVGVLTPYQGIDLLLEAVGTVWREIPNVKFLILGFPEEAYQQKAREMGLEHCTIFTGKINYLETPKYLALGTIAVSPKISTTEANLKLYTYLAMGLPTVVFDNAVNREILGDLGVYATNGHVQSLAHSIVELLQDEFRLDELRKKSYQKAVSCYSWNAVGQQLLESYQHVGIGPVDHERGGICREQ